MADDPYATPNPQPINRKLTTILAADVANYSRLMADNEEQTLHTFRDHKQICETLIELHGGRIFNTAGDSILAEFGSPVEAVRCATEIQPALRTRNNKLPERRRVRFRIGINIGDVIVQNTDLLGDGVNVAARLQAAAPPEGICISGTVYDQVQSKLSLSFKSHGEHIYKNIPRPIRTFSIVDIEGHGALPSPAMVFGRFSALARWSMAASLVVVLMLAGYWAYSEFRKETPVAGALLKEPPVGMLGTGSRVLVDDGSCPRGQIKEVIGGSIARAVARQRRCIARSN